MTRDCALKVVEPLTFILVLTSLAFALYIRFCDKSSLNPYGYIVLGLWLLVPPAWFLYEWTLCRTFDESERGRIKHFHELCRNLWLALVIVLAAIMGAENVLHL
jgi:hypothetical protein